MSHGRSRPAPATAHRDAGFVADEHAPVFVISVAAQLAGMHAQTLRQYDRLGIVTPRRTRGGGRRYSSYDVAKLREVQRLSQEEGVSLAGIQRIMAMADEIDALRRQVDELDRQLTQVRHVMGQASGQRVFAAGRYGDVVAVRPGERPRRSTSASQALVVWRPPR
ncbi:heat shock protein transcriptional repressor HspR [Austwickia sp. TVS 96-490-7B]|uniref:heat shock protein transcriptional repressor HspR n=1 Tax=Austwickia sp. TVS 96-490-7B TaxID=2830843 RepID=UPI00351CF2CB